MSKLTGEIVREELLTFPSKAAHPLGAAWREVGAALSSGTLTHTPSSRPMSLILPFPSQRVFSGIGAGVLSMLRIASLG